jgi:hypothetical protein
MQRQIRCLPYGESSDVPWLYTLKAYRLLVRDSSAIRRLFVRLAGAMGRRSSLHKANSGFASASAHFLYVNCSALTGAYDWQYKYLFVYMQIISHDTLR